MQTWINSRSVGLLPALAAALLFGVTAPLAKRFLMGIPAIEASGILYLSAGFALGLVMAAQALLRPAGTATRREATLRAADIPALLGAVVFGGLLGPSLLLFGLAHSSGTIASLLLNLEAVFTVLLAVLLGESLDKRAAVGVAAIVLGGAVLTIDPAQWGSASVLGTLAIAGACLSWGIDNNVTQRLSGRDPMAIVAVKGIAAGGIALGIAAAMGARMPSPLTIGMAVVLGAAGYGLSLFCFVLALRHIGTARTGSLFATAPFIGALASILVLREVPSWLTLAAGGVMAIGVFLMVVERHDHEHTHAELEHDHAHVHDEHHQHDHDGHEGLEPHSHPHMHLPLTHKHPHHPDLHHRHAHS